MKLLPDDGLAIFSRRASVLYALPILLALALYAHENRFASVAFGVSMGLLGLVFAAVLCVAGTSGQTRTDPLNALALLLVAIAFLLDGFFLAGAATFGPTPILDVGVGGWQRDPSVCDFWREGRWMTTHLSGRITEHEYELFRSWANNLEFTNDLSAYPGRIQLSTWDGQVYWVSMKNRKPPLTIGQAPQLQPRSIFELLCGFILAALAFLVYREGQKTGIRFKKYESLSLW